MTKREIDVVAVGTCYVDTNVHNFPFNRGSIVGEELIGDRYDVVPGGSAVNFCRLGSALELQTAFIGITGDDANGDTLEHLLNHEGVKAALVRRPELQTNISFNMTNSENDHIMLTAGTANAALDPTIVMPKLSELLPEARILYLGGCLKLKAFEHAFAEIVQLANESSAELVIDHGRVPATVSPEMIAAVKDLVLCSRYYFPSREEFCALWQVTSIDEGMSKLQKLAPNLTVVVKDGARGAFYWANNSTHNVEANKVDTVVNATGAGDSFNAGVITALLSERVLPEAIAYGCKVAAAKITAADIPAL